MGACKEHERRERPNHSALAVDGGAAAAASEQRAQTFEQTTTFTMSRLSQYLNRSSKLMRDSASRSACVLRLRKSVR